MKKVFEAERYLIVEGPLGFHLASPISGKILQALSGLAGEEGVSYDQLKVLTGASTASLYVFCQRLEEHGLIERRRTSMTVNNVRRVRTLVFRKGEDVVIHTPHILR